MVFDWFKFWSDLTPHKVACHTMGWSREGLPGVRR